LENLNVFELIETRVPASSRRAFERLLSPGADRAFVLGCNRYAKSVARVAEVQAFVDDYTDKTCYLGRPIVKMSSLPSDCLVVSCVVDGRPITALERLSTCSVRTVVDYFTLLRLAPDLFEAPDYCGDNRADISANLSCYQWVYDHLADEESRETFRKVVQFRYTFDLEFMRGFSMRIDQQYFEDFVKFGPDEVFVDGGGYDGQTTLGFASRAKAYQQIYYFEPSPEMMANSKEKLGHLKRIQFIQRGLFSREGSVKFDASAGPASRISDSGAMEIQLTTLDKAVSEAISLIKLDIEGAEFEAINGASNHIRAGNPLIAVCVYHNQSDFWRIPQRILELNDRYKMYLRHYSEGILETVMFFVPRN
jgi:FkbM family methyltransferase